MPSHYHFRQRAVQSVKPESLARAFSTHFTGVPSTNIVQVLVSSADVPSWAVIDTLIKKQSPSLTPIISV